MPAGTTPSGCVVAVAASRCRRHPTASAPERCPPARFGASWYPEAPAAVVGEPAGPFRAHGITAVCGIESRGFLLGAATAVQLGVGFAAIRPRLAAGVDARGVEEFLLRPPAHPVLVPARELLWQRVAQRAYVTVPPYAHELYGRPAPASETVTRRLRTTGTLLRRIPARPRRPLPPEHVLRAVAGPGPEARPAPYKAGRDPAILDQGPPSAPDRHRDTTPGWSAGQADGVA